jgi:hypothetical protein
MEKVVMKFKAETDDRDSVWEVTESTLEKMLESGAFENPEELKEYLEKAKDWKYYVAENDPCYFGDDIYIAYSESLKVAYFTFDGWFNSSESMVNRRFKNLEEALLSINEEVE